jgi:hypothetical protein
LFLPTIRAAYVSIHSKLTKNIDPIYTELHPTLPILERNREILASGKLAITQCLRVNSAHIEKTDETRLLHILL